MVDMVVWFRAVLDNDEATAKAAAHAAGHSTGESDRWEHLASYDVPGEHSERSAGVYDTHGNRVALTIRSRGSHIARHDPRQALARVEAERAVLDLWEFARMSPHSEAYGVLTEAVRALVSGYQHRPGYNPAWSPRTP